MDIFQILLPILVVIGALFGILIVGIFIHIIRVFIGELCFLCKEGWNSFKGGY